MTVHRGRGTAEVDIDRSGTGLAGVDGKPVDMRKSFDGLFTLVANALGEDPMSGDLFLFLNRRRNTVKGLL